MSQYSIATTVFDPVRFTTATSVPGFFVDTWYDHAIITQNLYTRLPELPKLAAGKVRMSSGMVIERPRVEIGVQINNVRAVPITAYIVDEGAADLLLGSDFMNLLFEMGRDVRTDAPRVTIEPPCKREKSALAIRLLSETGCFAVTDVEHFIGALRTIHNCSLAVDRGLFDHWDLTEEERENRVREAVASTLLLDANVSSEDRLRILWIENGSIWLTIKSGATCGVAWLSKLFHLTMNAKLEQLMADAATARQKAEVGDLTRNDIILTLRAEEQLKTAKAIRQAREEWRKTVLGEIDFRERVYSRVKDPTARKVLLEELDEAISELSHSKLYAMTEHMPDDSVLGKCSLPEPKQNRDGGNCGEME